MIEAFEEYGTDLRHLRALDMTSPAI